MSRWRVARVLFPERQRFPFLMTKKPITASAIQLRIAAPRSAKEGGACTSTRVGIVGFLRKFFHHRMCRRAPGRSAAARLRRWPRPESGRHDR